MKGKCARILLYTYAYSLCEKKNEFVAVNTPHNGHYNITVKTTLREPPLSKRATLFPL